MAIDRRQFLAVAGAAVALTRSRAVADPEPEQLPASPEPASEAEHDVPIALETASVDPRALIDAYEARNARAVAQETG